MSVLHYEGYPRHRRGLSRTATLRRLRAVPMYLVLAAIMALIIAPFLWMVSSAFKDQTAIYASPPEWIPSAPTTQNFIDAWNQVPFGWFLANSLKVAGLITIGQLVTCSLAAYAFARLRFPGRDIIFGIYLSSLMVPSQVTIIPLFIVMRNLGLIDNHASLILPGLASAFGTFLLRQFFMTVPRELEEAAIIDGCGLLAVLRHVILPLSAPALAALAIFSFNGAWNDFFNPLIFLSSPQKLTLPAGLALLQGEFSATSPAIMLAGVCMAVLPVLIVFMLGQRYIVEGITMTGIKG